MTTENSRKDCCFASCYACTGYKLKIVKINQNMEPWKVTVQNTEKNTNSFTPYVLRVNWGEKNIIFTVLKQAFNFCFASRKTLFFSFKKFHGLQTSQQGIVHILIFFRGFPVCTKTINNHQVICILVKGEESWPWEVYCRFTR